jgi:predicted DNA-binding transcriptional regulator AlpA
MRREREPEPVLLTRREVARMLAVTERHIQNMDKAGLFRPLRLGASVRYVRAEVEETIRRLADGDGK